MKNYKDMDPVEKQNIDKNIELTKIFIQIMQDGDFSDKKLSYLKSNFELMKIALSNLGVEFKERETIKKLNEKVREMEEKHNTINLNYNDIALFIKQLKNKVENSVKESGIHCSVDISFSPELTIDLNVFSLSENPFVIYAENEKEKEEILKEHNLFNKKSLENFEYIKSRDSYYLVHNEENIHKIKKIIDESCGLEADYQIDENRTIFAQEEDGSKAAFLNISHIKFTYLVLASSKQLFESFANFR